MFLLFSAQDVKVTRELGPMNGKGEGRVDEVKGHTYELNSLHINCHIGASL